MPIPISQACPYLPSFMMQELNSSNQTDGRVPANTTYKLAWLLADRVTCGASELNKEDLTNTVNGSATRDMPSRFSDQLGCPAGEVNSSYQELKSDKVCARQYTAGSPTDQLTTVYETIKAFIGNELRFSSNNSDNDNILKLECRSNGVCRGAIRNSVGQGVRYNITQEAPDQFKLQQVTFGYPYGSGPFASIGLSNRTFTDPKALLAHMQNPTGESSMWPSPEVAALAVGGVALALVVKIGLSYWNSKPSSEQEVEKS